MIIDLDVHASGESNLVPGDATQKAKSLGLDGLLISVEPGQDLDTKAWESSAEEAGIRVFFGTRIETNRGHLLSVFKAGSMFEESWVEKHDGIPDAESVINVIEEKGGIAVALRPYDRDVERPMGDHLFSLQGIAACEVQNGKLARMANDLALEAASNMEIPCVGGSAAAETDELGTAGTLLRGEIASQEDLLEALRTGDCWPVTFSDEAPASELPQRNARRRSGGGGSDRSDRSDRSGGSSNSNSRGGRSSNRRGGGGRGRRSRNGEDHGNQVRAKRGPVDEDYGNRAVSDDDGPEVPDDIGNRRDPSEDQFE